MKINWDAVNGAFGSFANFASDCKDSDYDVDGGFWDDIGKSNSLFKILLLYSTKKAVESIYVFSNGAFYNSQAK